MKNIARNLFLSVLLTFATAAFADVPGPGDPAQRQQHFLQGFGLTDALVTQVLDIFNTTRIEARTEGAQIKVLDAQIQAALTMSAPDGAAVDKLIDQKTALQGSLQKQVVAAEIQIHKLVGDKVFYELKDRFLSFRRSHAGFSHSQIPDLD